MKKILLVLICSLIALNSFSQQSKYCKKIKMKVDKFDNDTTYTSPIGGTMGWITFVKKADITFMSLRTFGKTISVFKKGVIVLLEDGNKIKKPFAEINSEAVSKGYVYSSFFKLNDEDIELLIASPITDYRLYIYEGKPVKKNSRVYQEILKCLKNK